MNLILLSGGSGKRLWPLSNDIRSKQFIKIFKVPDAENEYESMLQRTYRQIKKADPDGKITVAAGKMQVPAIFSQLGDRVGICAEPCRRDTFPAIALATAYLHDVEGLASEEAVVVCPVDPYVGIEYFDSLKRLAALAEQGEANLTLMGIEPTYPSEKYGYIVPASARPVSAVLSFREKPDAETAKRYIAAGALWNGGVFAYKLKYMLEQARRLLGSAGYDDLLARYDTAEKISFDYAVAEREPNIQVLRFRGEWKDVGTWNTLTEAMQESKVGDAVLSETCENVHVINETDLPILCMGLKDAVVSASAQGILVSDKNQSSYIKPFVEQFDDRVMFAEKSWGSYKVLDVEKESLTVKVTLNPGHKMNYHSHERRDEVWNVVSGRGAVVVNGKRRAVGPGDVVPLKAGCRHTIIAETELKVIEVQLGKEIDVRDKKKYGTEV